MVNITRQIMLEGMSRRFSEIDAYQRLIERARRRKAIKCPHAHGTDFEGEVSQVEMVEDDGTDLDEKWGIFPAAKFLRSRKHERNLFVDGVLEITCAANMATSGNTIRIEVRTPHCRSFSRQQELLEKFRA